MPGGLQQIQAVPRARNRTHDVLVQGRRRARPPAPGGQIGRAGSRRGGGGEKNCEQRQGSRDDHARRKASPGGLSFSRTAMWAKKTAVCALGPPRREGNLPKGTVFSSQFRIMLAGRSNRPHLAALASLGRPWSCSPTLPALAPWGGRRTHLAGALVLSCSPTSSSSLSDGSQWRRHRGHQLHDRRMGTGAPDCRIGNARRAEGRNRKEEERRGKPSLGICGTGRFDGCWADCRLALRSGREAQRKGIPWRPRRGDSSQQRGRGPASVLKARANGGTPADRRKERGRHHMVRACMNVRQQARNKGWRQRATADDC